MKNILKFLAIFTLASQILTYGFDVHAQSRPALKAIVPEISPFYEANPVGQPKGFHYDLLFKIVTGAGYELSATLYPASRTMQDLINGRFEATTYVPNPALVSSQTILASPRPITEIKLNVYARAGASPIHRKEDLVGKHVTVILGYEYGGLLAWLKDPANDIKLTTLASLTSAVRKLEKGRTEYALFYEVGYQSALKSLGRKPDNVQRFELLKLPIYIYLNREKVLDSEQVMKKLMQSHQTIEAISFKDPDQGF